MKRVMPIMLLCVVVAVLIVLAWLSRSRTGKADESARLRSDPTYSTRNYKQPNKAAAAQGWKPDSGVAVPPLGNTPPPNDKQPVPNTPPAGSITADHVTPTDDVRRNYKPQHPGRRPSRPGGTQN